MPSRPRQRSIEREREREPTSPLEQLPQHLPFDTAPPSPGGATAPPPTARTPPRRGGRGSSARCPAPGLPPSFAPGGRSPGCGLPGSRTPSGRTWGQATRGASRGWRRGPGQLARVLRGNKLLSGSRTTTKTTGIGRETRGRGTPPGPVGLKVTRAGKCGRVRKTRLERLVCE